MANQNNPVVEVARERNQAVVTDDVVTLTTGYRVRIKPVSASLIADVTARIKDPEVPLWENPKKGRTEPNPSDPSYIRACDRADQARGQAAMDAMAMFGVELVDGVPEDDGWVKRLALVGIEFDATDPVQREFYFKKHMVMDAMGWALVGRKSGVSQEGITQAEDTFQGN